MCDHDNNLDLLFIDHPPEQVLSTLHWTLGGNIGSGSAEPVHKVGIEILILVLVDGCSITSHVESYSSVINCNELY